MSKYSVFGIVLAAILGVAGFVAVPLMVENLDAKEIMVIQSPIEGRLDIYTEPGIKWQGFGTVTKYPRRAQYAFSSEDRTDQSKRMRFNDGGHALLSGAVSWEMPLDKKSIIEIHKKFGSAEGVEQQAVARMVDAAVYLAGPLMSSTESSGERRAELVQYINDQAENGVYMTKAVQVRVKDPVTGVEKAGIQTEIVRDADGNPKRQQSSILSEFNIRLLPLSINELKYDSVVEDQIKQRQVATTQVQIAVANARRAEQEALTIAKQGEAKAAETKWKQEAIKAQAVTEAQQKLEVARLAAEEAAQYKRQQILIGEGEAARKRLVMEADGALAQKLETYKEVQATWAKAVSQYGGAWVPGIVMGGQHSSTTNANGAQALVDLLTAKTAKELSLDLRVEGKK